MKFLKPIEVQAGISDGDPTNPLGQAGYLLSSDGSNVNWVSPGGLSAETAEAIVQPIKANEALVKGDPVYIVGFNNGQNTNIVAKADSSDPTKMPVVGLVDDDYANNAFGTMTAFGSFNGAFDTTGGTESWAIGDIIFVKPGGGLTNIKPGGTDLIQNIAIVSRVQQNTGELEVIALGRTNDVPNLPTGRLFVGTAANTSLASDVIYVDDTSDRVGIGTANPSTDLEVSSTSANGIVISKTSNQAQVSGRLFFTNDTPIEGFALFNSSGTLQVNSGGIPNNTSGTNRISIIGSSGNVGIGETQPNAKLEVVGTTGVIIDSGTPDSAKLTLIGTSGGYGGGATVDVIGASLDYMSYTLSLKNGPSTLEAVNQYTQYNSQWSWDGNKTGNRTQPYISYDFKTQGSSQMTIYNNNVGIGTTAASQKLHVNGSARVTGAYYDSSNSPGAANSVLISTISGTVWGARGPLGGGTTNYLARWTPDANTLGIGVTYDNGTNVGIGTINPQAKLDVYGGLKLGTTGTFTINQSPFSTTTFYAYAGNGSTITFGAPAATTQNVSVQGDLYSFQGSIGTKFQGTFNNKISQNGDNYLNSGNLGIGTTSPNAKLEVAGSTRITGSVDVGYGNNNTNYVQIGSGRTTSGFAFIDLIGDATYNDYGFRIIRNNIGPNADTDILHRGTGDLDLKTIDAGDIGLHTASIQRVIVKSGGDVGIGTTSPSSKLQVNGGVQLANDTAVASASKVGTFRYRTSGNNSYVDMCMQTGASTYAWVNIVTNSW